MFSKKKEEKKAKKKQSAVCSYDIEQEGRELKMVVRCKDCKDNSSLKERNCLFNVVNSFSKEMNIDAIILSHNKETEYFDSSIELLKKITQFAGELNNLSLRNPSIEIFNQPEENKTPCIRCSGNPKTIYPQLREIFIIDIEKFYNTLLVKIDEINHLRLPNQNCQSCKSKTIDDFNYLADMYTELGRFIRYKGYKIVS